MSTLLVVEDEPKIAQIARDYLTRAGYAVTIARDGREGLALARSQAPSLVVLDLKLPALDGLDVARALRRESDVPIIMLTARAQESDRLIGLEIGADDYITKPFSPRELVARVNAVLRRTAGRPATDEPFQIADLTIDPARLAVSRGGEAIDLTPSEFHILASLARQPGRIFTRAQLLGAVNGTAVEAFERAIDTHVKNIRRKLETSPGDPRYILTVYGIGYRFRDA